MVYIDFDKRKNPRLFNYDYSKFGLYFITVCAFQRRCIFGEVADSKIKLSEIGQICEEELILTSKKRLNISILNYAIMPNHLHFVLQLDSRSQNTSESFARPTKSSVPTIVRSIKSSVTREVRRLISVPDYVVWQGRYYEHVIRDEKSYEYIADYIENNPVNWEKDKYFEK